MWNKIKISKIQSFSFFLFFPFIVSGCDFLNREVDSFKNRLEVLYCSRPNINDGINGGPKYNLKPLEINVSTLERYVFNKDNKVETWTDLQSVPYDLLSPSRGGSITIGELSEGKYGYLYVIIFDKINGKTYYYDYEKDTIILDENFEEYHDDDDTYSSLFKYNSSIDKTQNLIVKSKGENITSYFPGSEINDNIDISPELIVWDQTHYFDRSNMTLKITDVEFRETLYENYDGIGLLYDRYQYINENKFDCKNGSIPTDINIESDQVSLNNFSISEKYLKRRDYLLSLGIKFIDSHFYSSSSEIDWVVSIAQISKDFSDNSILAEEKYLNKSIQTNGIISRIDDSLFSDEIVSVVINDPSDAIGFSKITCHHNRSDDIIRQLFRGDNVQVRGFVKSEETGVILTDCFYRK